MAIPKNVSAAEKTLVAAGRRIRSDATEVRPRSAPPVASEAEADTATGQQWQMAAQANANAARSHGVLSGIRSSQMNWRADAIRLVEAPPVGEREHRSGWPFVLQSLRPLLHPDGLLFDDFVERTFLYDMCEEPYRESWIGVFHHPFSVDSRLNSFGSLSDILRLRPLAESLLYLKGAVVLSDHLAHDLRAVLKAPVYSAKHPSSTPDLKWTPEAFLSNESPKLVQVGAHLRNTRLIHQIEPLEGFSRWRLDNRVWWLPGYHRCVVRYWRDRTGRQEYAGVSIMRRLSNMDYDQLLAANIVCSEVFATSANNLVVECIVRNTPVVINRHPAVEEYLGSEYPLYFEHPREIPSLLTFDRILEAHEHLLGMDKRRFDGGVFRENLLAWLRGIADE